MYKKNPKQRPHSSHKAKTDKTLSHKLQNLYRTWVLAPLCLSLSLPLILLRGIKEEYIHRPGARTVPTRNNHTGMTEQREWRLKKNGGNILDSDLCLADANFGGRAHT